MYMDSSSGQQQEMSQHSLENMLVNSNTQQQQEGDLKKPRPQPEQALKCPRCDSINTKFCYYNNYSLSQPRYFCKSCRRYWTKGGTLRNVPVGGGCRKNKRSSSSKRSSQDQQPLTPNHNNPLTNLSSSHYDSNDLTLAFARLQQKQQSCGHLGFDDHHQHDFSLLGNSSNTSCEILGNPIVNYNNPGFIDSLRNGFIESHSNFQNFQYGFGNGNAGEVENGSVGVRGEIGLGYDQEINNVKQEFCNGRENDENRVLWGFPNWQLNGETNNLGNFENGREGWNGIASSSWHGLLNSTPLM